MSDGGSLRQGSPAADDVAAAAETAPVVLLNRGQPRLVVMSAAEIRRLKSAAGEAIPADALSRRPLVIRGGIPQPGEA